MEGESNHHFMNGTTLINNSAVTLAEDISMMYNAEMGYPYCIPTHKLKRSDVTAAKVKGELYIASDVQLQVWLCQTKTCSVLAPGIRL